MQEQPTRLIRIKKVMNMTAMSRSNVYKLMSEKKFPSTVPLGGRAVAWIESEVEEWMMDRIAERDGGKQTQVANLCDS
ncbi:helix-turn-helix transcriptional regulator [Celerinatantimonas sp. YJH-8]|uniref:helix-turn-helix transcriptional regulator n=1 Tax=Celerinatantimonas sp. YJH-8 TaxID=3228714 RepID=UPI0038CB9705